MLPIPERIIGSKRLFIPLAYVGVTVTLCYYFVLAFVHMPRLPLANSERIQSQDNFYQSFKEPQSLFVQQFEEEEGSPVAEEETILSQEILLPLNPAPRLSLSQGVKEDRLDRRSVKNFTQIISSREDSHTNDGTRRSQPSKIWSRHQDRPHWIDFTAPMYSPWPNDDKCKLFQVQFAHKHTFPPRALVSFPGSGNSWLRYLLEGSTGIFTGSIFKDSELYHSGLLGERRSPVDGSTLLQKTHDDSLVNSKSGEVFKKMTELVFQYRGILLIRNPYDALHSYWDFINTRDHKGHAANQSFTKWKSFVEDASKKWTKLIQDWLENSRDVLLIQYEELRQNPRKGLLRILHYLEMTTSQTFDKKERLDCVLSHLEGPFKRDHSSVSQDSTPRPSFTSNNSHLDLIVQENIEHINRLLAIKEIPLRLNYTLHSNHKLPDI